MNVSLAKGHTMSSNQVGGRVRVRKDKRSGVVVSQNDSRFEVAFPDGATQYRDWFSAEELEFLGTPSPSEINKSFAERLKEKMDSTSHPLTSSSQQKVVQLRKKPKKKD